MGKVLKKNTLILAALAMLIFFSCKKDSPKISIVGKWYYSQDILKQYNNGSLRFTGDTVSTSDYQQFNSDGTGVRGPVVMSRFNYVINNDTVILNTPEQTVNDPNIGAYILPASTEKAVIKTMTSNTLELYIDDKNSEGTGNTEDVYFTK